MMRRKKISNLTMNVIAFYQFWYKTTYTEIWQNNESGKNVELPETSYLVSLRHLSIVWKTQIARRKTCSITKSRPQPIKSEIGHCFQESILNNRSTKNFQDKQIKVQPVITWPRKIALLISHLDAKTIENFEKNTKSWFTFFKAIRCIYYCAFDDSS